MWSLWCTYLVWWCWCKSCVGGGTDRGVGSGTRAGASVCDDAGVGIGVGVGPQQTRKTKRGGGHRGHVFIG